MFTLLLMTNIVFSQTSDTISKTTNKKNDDDNSGPSRKGQYSKICVGWEVTIPYGSFAGRNPNSLKAGYAKMGQRYYIDMPNMSSNSEFF